MSELENNNTSVAEPVPVEPTMDPALLEEMVKAGVLYGRKKTKTHPRMKPFIFATRNDMEIIDLPKTIAALDRAGEFLKEAATKGGLFIIVGTQPAAQTLTEEFANKLSLAFAAKRWLGGTLTNFKTVRKRTDYYIKLKSDLAGGRLDKYTKKERTMFGKEVERMDQFFRGLEKLTRLPDAMIVINANEHMTAVREAKRLKIPIVGIISTDTDPELVTYPILANDNSKTSINWILEKLGAKISEGAKIVPVLTEVKK